jgi:hypothetical protein
MLALRPPISSLSPSSLLIRAVVPTHSGQNKHEAISHERCGAQARAFEDALVDAKMPMLKIPREQDCTCRNGLPSRTLAERIIEASDLFRALAKPKLESPKKVHPL